MIESVALAKTGKFMSALTAVHRERSLGKQTDRNSTLCKTVTKSTYRAET